MKHALLIIALLIASKSFSQTIDETLKKSNDLIAAKQYDKAFNLLQKADPDNNNGDIVLAKENILLGYFVTSIMHITFALKDLQPNESVDDYRGKEGNYRMYIFPADSILLRLIKTQPDNYKLYLGLGNYYYEVFLHYNANWEQSADALFKLIEENYTKAISLHAGDYMTYYELGYIEELQKKYQGAINYFLKSIELDSKYANSYYNLGLAYLYTDDRANALKYALKSIDLYANRDYKGDAARMTGEIYGELNDTKNEIYYYELSDKIDPGNYNTLKSLLTAYVSAKSDKEKGSLDTFYSLAPGNPTIYNDLSGIYASQPGVLIDFYESKLPLYTNDKKVYGGLNFYLAQLYVTVNKQKAKDCLLKARAAFSTVFEKDNEVFKAIDTLMTQAQ